MFTVNIYIVCGYLFVGMSDDEYPFRFLLNIFLFSTLALNSVVTSLMGTYRSFPPRNRDSGKSGNFLQRAVFGG
jgi:hypothetical protein